MRRNKESFACKTYQCIFIGIIYCELFGKPENIIPSCAHTALQLSVSLNKIPQNPPYPGVSVFNQGNRFIELLGAIRQSAQNANV